MGTAKIRIEANTEQARRSVRELGKDLDNLNKKRAARRNSSSSGSENDNSGGGEGRKKNGKKNPREEEGMVASYFSGLGKEALKATAALGSLAAILAALKNIDFIKNGLDELKSYMDGFSTPGKNVGESLDWHSQWADKGKKYRMTALDTYASEKAARVAWGTGKGSQMIEKADSFVSEALSGDSTKSKVLVKDMGMSVQDVLAMANMNAEERLMTIMKKVAGMSDQDEANSILSSILGSGLAGDAKAAKGELATYEQMRAQYKNEAEPDLNEGQMKFKMQGATDMNIRRDRTELERNRITGYQMHSGLMDEESRRQQAENFNAGANARNNSSEFMWRKNIADDYLRQSGYTIPKDAYPVSPFDEDTGPGPGNISPFDPEPPTPAATPSALTKTDYIDGVSQIVGAIATASQPPASNDRPPARFA